MAHLSLTDNFPLSFQNESTIQPSLGEDFLLCDNGNMIFHWADYHETCDAVKKQLENNPEMKIEFKRKEMALNRLSLITVWIRTEKKVHQTNMYDLYERYILNQMMAIGLDPFAPIEISFISGTGPFRSMVIAECFNDLTYKDFVTVYLLKDLLPKRDYRIRLKSKVLIEYGADFNQAGLIGLEQLTMHGLLFSVDSEVYTKEISKEGDLLRILIDLNLLAGGRNKTLPELKAHLSQYAFNLMYSSNKDDAISCHLSDMSIQSSFDFLKNKKVYLFISYDKLVAGNGKIQCVKDFVVHTRDLIRTHYKQSILAKSA